jgi:hypothetical protein
LSMREPRKDCETAVGSGDGPGVSSPGAGTGEGGGSPSRTKSYLKTSLCNPHSAPVDPSCKPSSPVSRKAVPVTPTPPGLRPPPPPPRGGGSAWGYPGESRARVWLRPGSSPGMSPYTVDRGGYRPGGWGQGRGLAPIYANFSYMDSSV